MPTPSQVESKTVALQGEMSARFLRHEGYLGAVGAYLKVHPMPAPPASGSESAQGKVSNQAL